MESKSNSSSRSRSKLRKRSSIRSKSFESRSSSRSGRNQLIKTSKPKNKSKLNKKDKKTKPRSKRKKSSCSSNNRRLSSESEEFNDDFKLFETQIIEQKPKYSTPIQSKVFINYFRILNNKYLQQRFTFNRQLSLNEPIFINI